MRRSGKTYRACLRAALAASEGKIVVFESHTCPHLEHAIRMLRGIVEPLVCGSEFHHTSANKEIRFPGGGAILFATCEMMASDPDQFRHFRGYDWHRLERIADLT